MKRSQRFGIHPRLDWWMRIKQPDDSKGKNPRLGGEGRVRAGKLLSNQLVTVQFKPHKTSSLTASAGRRMPLICSFLIIYLRLETECVFPIKPISYAPVAIPVQLRGRATRLQSSPLKWVRARPRGSYKTPDWRLRVDFARKYWVRSR